MMKMSNYDRMLMNQEAALHEEEPIRVSGQEAETTFIETAVEALSQGNFKSGTLAALIAIAQGMEALTQMQETNIRFTNVELDEEMIEAAKERIEAAFARR